MPMPINFTVFLLILHTLVDNKVQIFVVMHKNILVFDKRRKKSRDFSFLLCRRYLLKK